MKGLVLAGGHGTRLRPLTFTGNKHMIPIANEPILFYGLRSLARAGIRDVEVNLGPIEVGIRSSVVAGRRIGLKVEYIAQGEPRGLADAVLCARDFLGEDPFLMYLGDNLLQSGVTQFVERFRATRPDGVVGATPVARPEGYGVVEVDGERIVSLEEKPSAPRSNLALIGVYLFTEAIHPVVAGLAPSRRGELEITDAIWQLVRAGRTVSVIPVQGWWKDTGHPGDLLEANELVLRSMRPEELRVEGTIEAGAEIEGPVGVGSGSIVEAGATIVGPSILGPGVRVTRGSRVGPFCAVGQRVTIGRSSLSRSIILDGAQLSGVSIVNSLVGRDVELRATRPSPPELTLTVGDSSRIVL